MDDKELLSQGLSMAPLILTFLCAISKELQQSLSLAGFVLFFFFLSFTFHYAGSSLYHSHLDSGTRRLLQWVLFLKISSIFFSRLLCYPNTHFYFFCLLNSCP